VGDACARAFGLAVVSTSLSSDCSVCFAWPCRLHVFRQCVLAAWVLDLTLLTVCFDTQPIAYGWKHGMMREAL